MYTHNLNTIKVIFILLAMQISAAASAKEIVVGADKEIHSIKTAIAIADSGDVILVYKGLYEEGNILINKSITLCGIGNPVIDGKYIDEVITIQADHASVDGFTIQHSGKSDLKELAGIHIVKSNGVIISNNELKFNFFSIVVDESKSCFLYRNKIRSNATTESSSGNGIHCWKSSNLIIESNTITGQRDGIYFEFVTETLVKNNLSEKNLRYGIHFMFSNHDTYFGNTFSNNGSGVAVMYSHHVNIFSNTFENNHGGAAYGLLLKELTDSRIISNYFLRNTTGIYLEGTSRSVISKNEIRENGWALKVLGDCNSDTLSANDFYENTFDVSTNAIQTDNIFFQNYWDKYQGYDIDKDGKGDIPFHPVSLYSKLVEDIPNSILLLHSFLVDILDQTEKIIPSVTPEQFRDDAPMMKPYDHASN